MIDSGKRKRNLRYQKISKRWGKGKEISEVGRRVRGRGIPVLKSDLPIRTCWF